MSSLFKNLTRGIRFNTNRFLDDAVKLQIVKSVPADAVTEHEHPTEFNGPLVTSTGTKKRKLGVEAETEIKTEPEEGSDNELEEITDDEPVRKKKPKKVPGPAQLKQRQEEQLKHFRRIHKIHIWGFDIPNPVKEFSSIPYITEQLASNIKNCGYEVPTPVQMQAIPVMINERELTAFAATGSGKTAAYLVPIIMHCTGAINAGLSGTKVIVSPTKELAAQIYRECQRLSEGTGLHVFNLAGKDSKLTKKKKKKIAILITTPNRLVYAFKEGEIDGDSVDYLIVDECDNLFEEGFQEQLGSIYSSCTKAKHSFFSATCSYQVEQFCKAHLDNHVTVVIGAKNSAVDLVDQSLMYVGNEVGKLLQLRQVIAKGIQAPVLIFVQSQERADELFKELLNEGLKIGVIHSGKPEGQRQKTIEAFRLGKIWMLITTALLSRGMDFLAVRTVINYDMPCSIIQYIHSIGRTGRAGKSGTAITFFTEDDKENLRKMGNVLANAGFPVPEYLLKLKRSRREVKVIQRPGIGKQKLFMKKKFVDKKVGSVLMSSAVEKRVARHKEKQLGGKKPKSKYRNEDCDDGVQRQQVKKNAKKSTMKKTKVKGDKGQGLTKTVKNGQNKNKMKEKRSQAELIN